MQQRKENSAYINIQGRPSNLSGGIERESSERVKDSGEKDREKAKDY